MPKVYKLFAIVLHARLKPYFGSQPKEQAGFRRNFSTTDHLQTINQVIEKCKEYNIQIYLMFIDLMEAFDKLNQTFALAAPAEHGLCGNHREHIRKRKSTFTTPRARPLFQHRGRGKARRSPITFNLYKCLGKYLQILKIVKKRTKNRRRVPQ